MDETGYFLFSFDTELAMGRFDLDQERRRMFSKDGTCERQVIVRLIDLFEEYNIVGTWAIVGHLFMTHCEDCEDCLLMDWKGRYSSFEEVYETKNPLWYGGDVIEYLLARGSRQEIAFHGFSHKTFDETQTTAREAKKEIREWLRLADRIGIVPHAVAFPRNVVGHLDAFGEAGFLCYRREPRRPWLIRNKIFGRYAKAIDQILGLSELPIFEMEEMSDDALVPLFSSQCFFDLNRSFEQFLDAFNLHNLRFRRVIRGIRAAAEQKKIVHLWAHPCDFRTEKDFTKLRHILDAVSQEIIKGRMLSVGMTDMATRIIAKHATNERIDVDYLLANCG